MKTILKNSLIAAFCGAMSLGVISCSENSDDPIEETSKKELLLQKAIVPYVNNTIIPTYKGMADASIEMYDKCVVMQEAFNKRTLSLQMVKDAGNAWNTSRKYWELSEAFLYGAASDYNIDPHIDSWPLDKASMEAMLKNSQQMAQMSPEYVGNNLGYGLLGFHSVEYMLFQLDASEDNSEPRSIDKFTAQELIYLTSVAGDLRNQCIRLEAAWAGLENVSSQKQELLKEAELEPSHNYGKSMLNAGQSGSLYKNYLEAAQTIIQGCIDIADEVGNQKIGRPANGSSEADKNYIESPYSLNSITDFTDNILSIRNSYIGSNNNDASISDYIKSVDKDLDNEVKSAIQSALDAIAVIPEPFAKNALSADADKAVEVVGTNLVATLEKVADALSRY